MRRRSIARTAAATLGVAGCGGNAADEDGEQAELPVGVLPITAVAPICLTEVQGSFELFTGIDEEAMAHVGGLAATEDGLIDGEPNLDELIR